MLLASGIASAQGAKLTDPQIAHIAYTAGQLDIEAAQQALQKSTNKDVVAFAKDMERDHTAVNDQALALVFFIAPTHMNCDQVLRGRIVNVTERIGVPIGVVKDLRGISAQARWAPVEMAHHPSDAPDHGRPQG